MSDKKPVQVIKSDLVDRMVFEDLQENSPRVQEFCADEGQTALSQDVFSSLYKLRPEVQKNAPSPQRELIQQMMQLPEYKNLVGDTRMDDIASAMGLTNLAPDVIEQYHKVQQKLEQKRKEREEQQKQDGGKKPKQGGKKVGQQPGQGQPDPNGQGQGPGQPGEGEGQGGGEPSFDDLSDQEQSEIRAALRGALKDAQEEVDETKEILAGWGIEPGELRNMPIGRKMELVKKLKNTPKYAKIAEMAGRFQNVKNAVEATTFHHGQDEIVDVTTGSDVMRVLPSEIIKFHVTPEAFYKDMVEGSLLMYQTKGTEQVGRGPIIVAADISGSMLYGGREEWCKASSLTLMEICRKQKRNFGFIAFESQVTWAEYWTKGRLPTVEDKIKIAELQSNGGTNFMQPIRAAFKFRDQDRDLKPADLVIITDGDCNFKPEELKWILEQKKQTNMRIFGIAVASGSISTLRQFCDQVVQLTSQGDVMSLKEIDELVKSVTAR